MAEEEDEQDDERYTSTASSWVSTSYSAARRARTGRSPRRDVAVGHAEAVLEAWAKWMDLAPVTLGDGYTGRGERHETKNLVVHEECHTTGQFCPPIGSMGFDFK